MMPAQKTEIKLEPIGHIRTAYREKPGTPRQPGLGEEETEGIITLLPEHNFEQALEDLAGFERVWIVTWLHQNAGWRPKVLPPRSEKQRRGVFATRSPHRPNPIGLSVCRLLSVAGREVRVASPDLLDGTPVLDIKPYIPYADAFPDSRAGWIDEIHDPVHTRHDVGFAALASAQLTWLSENFKIDFRPRIIRTLAHNPHPYPNSRITKRGDGSYVLAVKSWRVHYRIAGDRILVAAISSGYSVRSMNEAHANGEDIHDGPAHTAFHERWP